VKRTSTLIFAAAAVLIATSPVMAQPHDDHHGGPSGGPPGYVRHADWRKGGRIAPDDWRRGAPVDYRAHHLRRPPHGYEWRKVDGNYILAAAATGVIASLIAASH